jgi:hypothetical protein
MARTGLEQVRMTGVKPVTLDAVTALLLGLLGRRPTVRHRAGVTDEILSVLERAGLEIAEDMRVYETAEEAARHADRLIEEGHRIFSPYPLLKGRFADRAHLVAPELWASLNAKQNLDQIVPRENLPPTRIALLEDLAQAGFQRPVFLKACGEAATGAGYAVRYCPDEVQWAGALEWFRSFEDIDRLIVEDVVPHKTCWCVTFVVEPNRTTYIGAAEQLFSAPARQSGSMIDPVTPFPREGVELVVAVGEAARRRGYVGLAGLDIARADDGGFIVFDPNFRFNASSTQVLLHEAASARDGLPVSCSAHATTLMPFETLRRRIEGPIDDGWFVPTRLLDARWLPTAEGRSMCTGFVLGRDRAEAIARSDAFKTLLDA